MEDVIQINDVWYISALSHRVDTQSQVLKQGDTFAVLDRLGEAGKACLGEQGLYHRGTRHLSQWELSVNGRWPMLLNSMMKQDNSVLIVEFTTPDIFENGHAVLAKGTLHIFRSLVIQRSTLYEHLRLTNFSRQPLQLCIDYEFDADFMDMFEVRGVKREQRGERLEPIFEENRVVVAYRGLDKVDRRTSISFEGPVECLTANRCRMSVSIPPGQEQSLYAAAACRSGNSQFSLKSYAQAVQSVDSDLARGSAEWLTIETSNTQFDDWVNRSVSDLQMLCTETMHGRYPYAGVPWFSTPFGRDGIITALETLWVQPQMARGVLGFLAETQADSFDEFAESEPGKIIHEMREGEMAALGEVPFRRYYGTVDATPLFVMLAGRYYRRTGDKSFIESIWGNIQRAIQWIDESGDKDGDGFVEYQRRPGNGLVQQGWKDSDDSVFHADGSAAEQPIALSEVQGYVYDAKRMAAELAEVVGEAAWGRELLGQAALLKEKFHQSFWLEDLQTYAIALDGHKRPCAVRNSNAGHLLYSRILAPEFARRLTTSLLDDRSFNGWGIRTIARGEARFNPMSYHNGSVWPHDTAIAAAGMAHYGFRQESLTLLSGLFDAANSLWLSRLPELFCGFERMPGHGPTLYPVACSPQAWAAGAVFMLLQACLGLMFSADDRQVQFDHPTLPEWLRWVKFRNLRMGDAAVDLTLHRHTSDVGLNVDAKTGNIDVVLIA